MSKESIIKDEYFAWLLGLISEDCDYDPWNYEPLLRLLYSREFYWDRNIPLDENRSFDGKDLRIRYVDDNQLLNQEHILDILEGPCTVLEMLIGLAVRIEVHIMSNSEYGNRTGEWFFDMLDNMGLLENTDFGSINLTKANHIIDVFLNRDYDANGKGGLFYIQNSTKDLRKAEIWYQMNWYFSMVLDR